MASALGSAGAVTGVDWRIYRVLVWLQSCGLLGSMYHTNHCFELAFPVPCRRMQVAGVFFSCNRCADPSIEGYCSPSVHLQRNPVRFMKSCKAYGLL